MGTLRISGIYFNLDPVLWDRYDSGPKYCQLGLESVVVQEVPTHDQLFNPTLEELHALGGSASINEIVECVSEKSGIADDAAAQPHGTGNISELAYRLAWARTYLKKVGLVENSRRGVWSLTAQGQKTIKVDPRSIVRQVNSQRKDVADPGATPSAATTDDSVTDEFPNWTEQLLEVLLQLAPDAFERLCMRLLRESGFIEVEVTGRSGDGGIDGRGVMRVGGLISFNVLFQCKRYQNPVGPSVVRDFRGAMVGRADKGLVITTAAFTREARKEATRDGAPPIDLIDGPLLVEKLKDLGLGVSTKTVEVVDIDRNWFASI